MDKIRGPAPEEQSKDPFTLLLPLPIPSHLNCLVGQINGRGEG